MYLDNQIYHIYNRGAHRLNIFRTNFQYHYCLKLLEKYKSKYCVDILAYCLMPNHYHLLLRHQNNGNNSISRFIQTTFNAYVQAFNQMEQHSGTIFQGAVKGIAVKNDVYLCQLVAYIHFNPVKAGLTASPELWEFSDFRQWIGLQPFLFDGNILLRSLFKISERNQRNFEKAIRDFKNVNQDYLDFIKNYQEEKSQESISKYLLDLQPF